MANYVNTKAIIAQNIYTNHTGQVSAEMVKTAANEIVNTLIAGGYLYAGIAHPGDAAVTPDANVFYIASEAGTYTNKGGLVVADGEVAIFKWNGSWSKESTGAATAAQVNQLGQQVFAPDNVYWYDGYLDAGGNYVEANLGHTTPYIVLPKDVVSFVLADTRSQEGVIPSVVIYDKLGKHLQSLYVDGSGSGETKSGTTTILTANLPDGAFYFRAHSKSTAPLLSNFWTLPWNRLLLYTQEEVEDARNYLVSYDAYDTEISVGWFYNHRYEQVTLESARCLHTDKIPCSPGDVFYYRGKGYMMCRSVIYLLNDVAVPAEAFVIDSQNDYTKVTVPAGVNQVVFQSYGDTSNAPHLSVLQDTEIPLKERVLENRLDIDSLKDTVQGMISVGNSKYIALDIMDFRKTPSNWLALGTWNQSANGIAPAATGNALAHQKQYLCDSRFARFVISAAADSVFRIDLKRSATLTATVLSTLGDGGSCYEFDFATKKIAMYGMGADSASDTPSDNAWRTAFLTNVIVEQAAIPDSMIPANGTREYVVDVYKRGLTHVIVLSDLVSGDSVSCSHTGWAVGRQMAYYTLHYLSGTAPILKSFAVYATYQPDLVIMGDSIQEGIGCLDHTKAWKERAAADYPELSIVLSALSGGTKARLERAVDNEYLIYLPKNIVITLGVNDVSEADYDEDEWVASMEEIIARLNNAGINVIWNCASLAAQPTTEAKIEHERRIRSLNQAILSEPGEHMRFDMALAIDHDIANPANPTLLYDTGHPNVAGQGEFYKRALCDSIVLAAVNVPE